MTIRAFVGKACFWLAGTLSCLIFADRWTELAIDFPEFWYRSRNFHLVLNVGLYVAGWLALRNTSEAESNVMLFDEVKLYTRPGCTLCDDALDLLAPYEHELPPVQLINIEGEAEFEQKYSDCIPVVEFDGREVFRGLVSAALLDRLLTARRSQLTTGSDQPSLENGA